MIIPISPPAPVSIEEIQAVSEIRTALMKMALVYHKRREAIDRRLRDGAVIERWEPREGKPYTK
jgi:hypothetical protein